MFMFNKCGKVLGTSDISWRFAQSDTTEFTHFKMAHDSWWTFRFSSVEKPVISGSSNTATRRSKRGSNRETDSRVQGI